MSSSSDVVHNLPPNHFGAFVNSITRTQPTNSYVNVVCQMFFWVYLVPCLVIYFVFYSLQYTISTSGPLIYSYLIVSTVFNCIMLTRVIANTNRRQNDSADLESAPNLDNPPTYSEAVKDPPSYSFLQYYKKMLKSSWTRKNNALGVRATSSSVSSPNRPQVPEGDILSRPELYRHASSPN